MTGINGEMVIRQLGQLGRDLDTEIKRLAELEDIAVEAEGDYKVAFARAMTSGSGSVEDRKQLAVAETDALWRTWGKAIAAVRTQRESIKALHARIDIGRTMASREKALVALAGRDDAV